MWSHGKKNPEHHKEEAHVPRMLHIYRSFNSNQCTFIVWRLRNICNSQIEYDAVHSNDDDVEDDVDQNDDGN